MLKLYLILPMLMLISGLTWAEEDLQQFCMGKSLNEVVVHPQNCSGYITCSEKPTVQYCEVGFYFDIKGFVCNWPEKVNCQLSARQAEEGKDFIEPALTPLAAFDIMTGRIISPMVDYDPYNLACRHFGAYFLPNPQTCRSYYLCAYGHMHAHSCGLHTLWDYKLQQCVLSHQAVCYQFNPEEEKELNLAVANITMVCYPANTNSSTSLVEPSTENVTNLTPATTTITPSPPTPPIITEISTTTKHPPFSNPYNITCPLKRQSYVAHPEDCGKYFMCIMGTAVMTSCPNGLLWDSSKAYCDASENVKCFQTKTINEQELETRVI